MSQTELRALWQQYELTGDTEALAAFVETHANSLAECGHKFPCKHRICDVQLRGRHFCVLRCVECEEKLAFVAIAPNLARIVPGVPYWLQGEMLAAWVTEEAQQPTKAPVDWERYRDFECPNKVSLWLANFPDRAAFEAYLDETIGDDDRTPLNRFAAEFGLRFYDHDFQEAHFSEASVALTELLNGVSDGDSFLPRAVETAGRAGWHAAKAFVLLYDFDYSRRNGAPSNREMVFIGTFDYQKPASGWS